MGAHSREIATTVQVGDFVANDVPTGLVNGINTVFVLNNVPVDGTVELTLNGIDQEPGGSNDYVIVGAIITFNKAPRAGSIILAHYVKQ